MKTKQIIFLTTLLLLCNYLAYYFGSKTPEYYTKPSDLYTALPAFIFILLSICGNVIALAFGIVELYEYFGKIKK